MKTLLLAALALAMTIGFVGKTYAKEKKAAAEIKGVFESLADDKKSIKVTTGGKKSPMEVTVAIDDTTKVTVDGAAATIADLKAGQKMVITPSTGTATLIEAKAGKKAK